MFNGLTVPSLLSDPHRLLLPWLTLQRAFGRLCPPQPAARTGCPAPRSQAAHGAAESALDRLARSLRDLACLPGRRSTDGARREGAIRHAEGTLARFVDLVGSGAQSPVISDAMRRALACGDARAFGSGLATALRARLGDGMSRAVQDQIHQVLPPMLARCVGATCAAPACGAGVTQDRARGLPAPRPKPLADLRPVYA